MNCSISKAFSAALLCGTLLFLESATAAPKGTLAGKIETAAVGTASTFPSSVRAINLYDSKTSFVKELKKSRNYSLKVPVGPYLVWTTAWNRKATAYRKKADVVFVTTKKASGRVANTRAIPRPEGPLVSVGNILWQNLAGVPYRNYDGRPWKWDDVFLTDLAGVKRSCNFETVEDREFGRFGDVLREIRLGASSRIDPSQRINLRRALQTLEIWAPQFRVTGSIISADQGISGGGTASLRLVDLARGKTVWSRDYPILDWGNVLSVSERAARDVERFLCGNDLPTTIQGSFTSIRTIDTEPLNGNVESYNGTVIFELADPDFWRAIPYPLGVNSFAPYVATSISYTGKVSGGSPCAVTGEFSDSFSRAMPAGVGGVLQLEVRPEEDQQRRYSIGMIAQSPNTNTATLSCPPSDPVEQTKNWAPSVASPALNEGPYRVEDSAIIGSFSQNIFDYSWSFQMVP